jgi:hypothetical protein
MTAGRRRGLHSPATIAKRTRTWQRQIAASIARAGARQRASARRRSRVAGCAFASRTCPC